MDPGTAIRDGRYRVVRVLGQGAQATTYEAVDVKEGRPVAVKRFVVKGAASWKDVELAEREALVMAGLDHALIPKVVEHFEEGGELFLVTELIEGESLAALQKRGGRLDSDELARLLADLADATGYLHGRAPPVIHRDIKPGNVVRRKDGRFCLVDFGAVRAKLEPSGGSTVVGTFGYMAPEQFQGRAMPQSDVYAAGATAISMLTGVEPEKLPHKGLAIDVRAALGGTQRESMVRVLEQLLEPDPDKRPASLAPSVAWLEERRRLRDSAAAPASPAKPQARRTAGPRPATPEADGAGWPFGPLPGPRRSRWQPPPPPAGPPPPEPFVSQRELGPPPIPEVLFAIARVAVMLSTVVFVPLLLSVLSIVFGPKLRRAAFTVREAGQRAIARIDRANGEFGEESMRRRSAEAGARVRVEAPAPPAEQPGADPFAKTESARDAKVRAEAYAKTEFARDAEAEARAEAEALEDEAREQRAERREERRGRRR